MTQILETFVLIWTYTYEVIRGLTATTHNSDETTNNIYRERKFLHTKPTIGALQCEQCGK